MSLPFRFVRRSVLAALAFGPVALPFAVNARASDTLTTSPDVGQFRTERIQPSNEPKPESFRKGVTPKPSAATDDVKPSVGVGVLDRMGAQLPALPPEKP